MVVIWTMSRLLLRPNDDLGTLHNFSEIPSLPRLAPVVRSWAHLAAWTGFSGDGNGRNEVGN